MFPDPTDKANIGSDKMKMIVKKLCNRDPHQFFQRLETLARSVPFPIPIPVVICYMYIVRAWLHFMSDYANWSAGVFFFFYYFVYQLYQN